MWSKKLRALVKFLIGLTGPKKAIRLRYFYVFRKLPNLVNPVTLNEKINAYKFMWKKYDFPRFANKIAVKSYVAERIGGEHIIPTIYTGVALPPIEERTWEMPYVIKMNHGSGWNIFVRNENERNWPEIEKKIEKWSKKTFGKDTGEIHYSKIRPMVLIEKFLSSTNGVLPTDFKFYMLNGKAEFIEIDIDREKNPKYLYFDTEMNLLPFVIEDFSYKVSARNDAPIQDFPDNFSEMFTYAEALSKDLPLVRVDFYNVNGKVYFGEMTMTPSAGLCYFKPEKFDYIYGKKLQF